MIIDSHEHLEEEIPAERLLQIMDRDGIHKAVVFAPAMESIPSTPDRLLDVFRVLLKSGLLNPVGRRIYNSFVRQGNLVVSGKSYRIFRDPDNETVGSTCKQHPDRFIFYAFLNPKGSRSPVEVLEELRSRFDLRGVKAHSWFHDFNPSTDLLPTARRCEELKIPMLIHLGGRPDTGNIEGLLASCPRLKLILAHAGIPYFQKLWSLPQRNPNVCLDLSGPYLNARLARKVVSAVGSEHVLFGTDAPYGLRTEGGHSFEPMKRWILDLDIPDRQKEAIFSGNLLRLLEN